MAKSPKDQNALPQLGFGAEMGVEERRRVKKSSDKDKSQRTLPCEEGAKTVCDHQRRGQISVKERHVLWTTQGVPRLMERGEREKTA